MPTVPVFANETAEAEATVVEAENGGGNETVPAEEPAVVETPAPAEEPAPAEVTAPTEQPAAQPAEEPAVEQAEQSPIAMAFESAANLIEATADLEPAETPAPAEVSEEKNITWEWTSEISKVKVTVTAPKSSIEEGTEAVIRDLTEQEIEQYREYFKEAGVSEEDMVTFDITFYDANGNEITDPIEGVEVSFDYSENKDLTDEKVVELEVIHIDDEEGLEIKDIKDDTNQTLVIEAESFSPFIIKIKKNNEDTEYDACVSSTQSECDNKGTYYSTLQDAVNADGVTSAILMDDFVLESTLNINKTITLDLNGHKIQKNAYGDVIQVTSAGDLTINDSGTTKGEVGFTEAGVATFDSSHAGRAVHSYGTLTINDGVYKGSLTIYVDGASGEGVINGGDFYGLTNGNVATIYASNQGEITIVDGNFNGKPGANVFDGVNKEGKVIYAGANYNMCEHPTDPVPQSGKITVEGGYFIGRISHSNGGEYIIKGGNFDRNVVEKYGCNDGIDGAIRECKASPNQTQPTGCQAGDLVPLLVPGKTVRQEGERYIIENVAAADAVASIGTKYYLSLRDAIADAEDGATIEMLSNDNVSFNAGISKSDAVLGKAKIVINKSLTINGNNKTLYGVSDFTNIPNNFGETCNNGCDTEGAFHGLRLAGNGNITFNNLNLSEFGDTYWVNKNIVPIKEDSEFAGSLVINGGTIDKYDRSAIVINGGTFDIDGLTIEGNATNKTALGDAYDHMQQGIYVQGTAAGSIKNTTITGMIFNRKSGAWNAYAVLGFGNGNVTIENSSFTSAGIYSAGVSTNQDSTATIRNTTINVAEEVFEVCDTSTINVESGIYNGGKIKADASTLVISGGTFNNDPSAYVPAGKKVTIENEKYVVSDITEGETVAKIGDIPYISLEDAIANAQDNDVIVMQNDYKVTSSPRIHITKNIILDLNGKTISKEVSGTEYVFAVNQNKEFTIKDTSTSGDGKISRKGGVTAIQVLGVLNVYGGIIESNEGCQDLDHGCNGSAIAIKIDDNNSPSVYGTVNINGGTITSDGQAIQAWGVANINGGTLNGQINAWTYPGDSAGYIIIKDGVTINGNISANQRYGSTAPTLQAKVDIQGGDINGSLSAQYLKEGVPYKLVTVVYEEAPISETDPKPEIKVSSGVFTLDPTPYVAAGKYVVADEDKFVVTATAPTPTNVNGNYAADPSTSVSGVEGVTTLQDLTLDVEEKKGTTESGDAIDTNPTEIPTTVNDTAKSTPLGKVVLKYYKPGESIPVSNIKLGHTVLVKIPVKGGVTKVLIVASHGGGAFGTVGLARADGDCDSSGEPSTAANAYNGGWIDVVDGYAPIYTCQASEFIVAAGHYYATLDSNGADSKGTEYVHYVYNTNNYYTYYADTYAAESTKLTDNKIVIPVKKGATFLGYYSGATKVIDTDGTIIDAAFNVDSNATYTAKWDKDGYNLDYGTITNGTYSTEDTPAGGHFYGETITLKAPTVTDTATNEFKGWTFSDGTDDITNDITLTCDENKETCTFPMPDNNVEATANIGKKQYVVTWSYKDVDGNDVIETGYVDHGDTTGHANPVPYNTVETGYTFTSWSSDPTTPVTANITYIAQYSETARSYTVTFKNENAGSDICTETITYGSKPTFTSAGCEEPTKPNSSDGQHSYTFSGWKVVGEDDSTAKLVADLPVVTADIEYTAVFTESQSTTCVAMLSSDSTCYPSLRAAVEAAAATDAITMMADDHTTFDSSLTAPEALAEVTGLDTKGRLLINKNITINGGDHTVYGISNIGFDQLGYSDASCANCTTPGAFHGIEIDGNQNVTINNLNLSEFGDTYWLNGYIIPISVKSSYTGKLTLNNVDIDKYNRSAIYIRGGEFEINGGSITANAVNRGTNKDYFQKGIAIQGTAHGTIDGMTLSGMKKRDTLTGGDWTMGAIEKFNAGSVEITNTTITITDSDADVAAILETSDDANGKITLGEGNVFTTNGETAVIALDGGQKGTVEVSSGTYNGKLSIFGESTGKFSIAGGTFSDEVLIDYCAPEKIPVKSNGKFTVADGYKVTFLDKDGNVTGPILPIEYLHKVTSPNAAPAEDGLTFKEWRDSATDLKFNFDTLVTKDITLKAIYTAEITFDSNGGTSVDSQTVVYNGTGTEPTAPTKDGHGFSKWHLTGVDSEFEFTTPITKDVTLYADWNTNSYTVVFDKNNTSAQGDMANELFAYGETKALSNNAFTLEGYDFAGWATGADLDVAYTDKQEVQNLAEDGSITLYAKWTQKSYTITWNNYDDSLIDTTVVSHGATPTHADVSRDADAQYTYTFSGWTAGTTEYASGSLPAATGEITYKASFKQTTNSYTITFDPNNGEAVWSSGFDYGINPAYKEGEVPTKTDPNNELTYTFSGWTNGTTTYLSGETLPVVEGVASYTAVYTSEQRDDCVAKIGDICYQSLADAIAAGDGKTVVLQKDTSEDIVIPSGTTITLDLNGNKLSNISSHTIINNGTLTIDGNGEVDNITNSKATIFNGKTGNLTINNGNFQRSLEAGDVIPGTRNTQANGNSYYTILNRGIMEIKGGTIENKGKHSSVVSNGYAKGAADKGTDGPNPHLTIYEGAILSGGKIGLKNDEYGVMEIKGGIFKNAWNRALHNRNEVTIDGGTFECSSADCVAAVTSQGYKEGTTEISGQGETIINGGTFNGKVIAEKDLYGVTGKTTITNGIFNDSVIQGSGADIDISGGTFSDQVELEYCADKFIPSSNSAGYTVERGWKVTYLDKDGSGLDLKAVRIGDTALSITAPTEANLTFKEWQLSGSNYNFDATVTKDITLKAAYTAEVTFDSNGGTPVASQTVAYSGTATEPTLSDIPSLSGHQFRAWQLNGVDYDFNTKLSGNIILVADWNVVNYTIEFVDEDGTSLWSGDLAYGEDPTSATAYSGTPTKAPDAQYTYTFDAWTPATGTVTGPQVYTASYTSSVNNYRIEFVNSDGSSLWSGNVAYGENPAVNYTETPTSGENAEYSYVFSGWKASSDNQEYASGSLPTVTTGETYTATYTPATRSHRIEFVDEDGTSLWSGDLAYGEDPTSATAYSGTPTKAPDAQYTYTFDAWTPATGTVTGPQVYTASYTSAIRSHRIEFVDEDGTSLWSGDLAYGEDPTSATAYSGTPTKAPDAQYTYTFDAWTPATGTVTGPQVYTASYTSGLNSYTVTWVNNDGIEIYHEDFNYGSGLTFAYSGKTEPQQVSDSESCDFIGWTGDTVLTPTLTTNLPPVAGAITYYANYSTVNCNKKQYTLTFVDRTGNVVEEQNYNVNTQSGKITPPAGPDRPSDEYNDYVFDRWTPDFTKVTGPAVYTATYTSTPREYVVEFVWNDANGVQSGSNVYYYNSGVTAPEGSTGSYSDFDYTYTFAGWSDGTAEYADGALPNVTTGVTYTAKYNHVIRKYTIAFVDYDLSVISSDNYAGDESVIVPANPSRTGYIFTGWTASGSTEIINSIPDVTKDETYTANYDPIHYTIEFDGNGGTGTPASMTETYDVTGYLNTDYARDGYDFVQWTGVVNGSDQTYLSGAKILNLTSVNLDTITLHAEWSAHVYTATFVSNSGTAVDDITFTIESGNTDLPTSANISRTGYLFSGWFDNAELDGVAITTIPAGSTGDKTFYAKWTPITYTIHYNSGDATSGTMLDLTMTYDTEENLTAIGFEKEGFEFSGWTATIGGVDTGFVNEQSVKNLTTTGDDVITLTAQWKEKGYQVTYKANGGSGTDVSEDVTYGGAYTFTGEIFSREGYQFSGWNTESDGNGEYKSGNVTWTTASGLDLYAIWTENTYIVTFDANEGTGEYADINTGYDVIFTLPSTEFTRTGYDLTGWSEDSNATVGTYTGGQEVKSLTGVKGATVKLYAIWSPKTYTVTYHVNDGTTTSTSENVTYSGDYTFTGGITREGYQFSGWNTKSDGNGEYKSGNVTWTTASGLDLYAIWTAETYTVTYDVNGGNALSPNTGSVTYGQAYGNLPSPTKTNASFNGWILTGGASVTSGTIVSITGDHTIYAQWTDNPAPAPTPSGGGSSGGGGGGGGSSKKDTTNNTGSNLTGTNAEVSTGDNNDNIDNNEENNENNEGNVDNDGNAPVYDDELIAAYNWAHELGITTMPTLEEAMLFENITREQLAKMMVVYISKVLGRQPIKSDVPKYRDVSVRARGQELYDYTILAYQFQIMGIDANGKSLEYFNPSGKVTRAEFATVLSRVLFGSANNQKGDNYREKHIQALEEAGILTNTDPTIQELRGWILLMLYRSQNDKTDEETSDATADEEIASDESASDESASDESASDESEEESEGTGNMIGMPNPASVYCEEQGGKLNIVEDAEGNQSGICKLADGTEVEEWEYYRANHAEESGETTNN